MTDRDEPALWERVRFLARAVGTRPPARIYLVPDVNAAVWENAKLLGLIPGRRSMMIGMPLLIALTPAQFDSVIAHELGHYGNRDTRLGALDHRARESVMAAVAAAQGRLTARRGADGKPRRFRLPGQAVFVALFRMYARLVLSVTQQASRRQEIAADSVAAAVAGQANAAAGLRELPAVEAAFSFYIDRYVAAGVERDMLPIPARCSAGSPRSWPSRLGRPNWTICGTIRRSRHRTRSIPSFGRARRAGRAGAVAHITGPVAGRPPRSHRRRRDRNPRGNWM